MIASLSPAQVASLERVEARAANITDPDLQTALTLASLESLAAMEGAEILASLVMEVAAAAALPLLILPSMTATTVDTAIPPVLANLESQVEASTARETEEYNKETCVL